MSLFPPFTSRLRIQAANSIGVGPFSTPIKLKTKALPPAPPSLECLSATYNSIKLKWNGSTPSAPGSLNHDHNFANTSLSNAKIQATVNGEILYIVEMMLETKPVPVVDVEMDDGSEDVAGGHEAFEESDFRAIYKGTHNSAKANKLQESSTYLFRICACNETGQGEWSDIYRFTTTKSPPMISKPTVSELTTSSCLVEWQRVKLPSSASSDDLSEAPSSNDLYEYCLQIQSTKKDTDYREVYRGPACSHRLKDLDPNTEYNVRVSASRSNTQSPFSSPAVFTTPKLPGSKSTNNQKLQSGVNSSSLNGSGANRGSKSAAASSKSLGSPAKKQQQSSSSSLFPAFLWPSFLPSFSSQKNAAAAKSSNGQSSTSVHHEPVAPSHNSHLNLKHHLKSHNGSAAPPSVVSTSYDADDDFASKGRISDYIWALLVAVGLVLIAFVIVYHSSSFFFDEQLESSSSLPPQQPAPVGRTEI